MNLGPIQLGPRSKRIRAPRHTTSCFPATWDLRLGNCSRGLPNGRIRSRWWLCFKRDVLSISLTLIVPEFDRPASHLRIETRVGTVAGRARGIYRGVGAVGQCQVRKTNYGSCNGDAV